MKNRFLLLAAGAAFVWAGCGEQVNPLGTPGGDQLTGTETGGLTTSTTAQAVTDPAGFVCETIDFNVDGDGTGTLITSLSAATVTMDVTVTPGPGANSTDKAVLYDTDDPIGPDPDLESTSQCTACTGLDEILVIEDIRGATNPGGGDTDGGGIITLDNFSAAVNFQIIEFKAVDDDDGPFALVVDGTETARSTSQGNGTVEVIAPTQTNFTTSADFWLGIATATGVTPRVSKTASGGFDDIRFCAECSASVGDFVWYDTNMDGIQDAGEAGIAGVTVTLYDSGMNVLATTTTDANGYYLFSGLCPGTYYVGVTPPAGYVASPTEQGTDTSVDSNPNPDQVILTAVDSQDLTYDFGFYLPMDEGCTRTYGYWKTHSEYGPAAKPDPTWDLLGGPDTPFFGTGYSYYEILQMEAKGGNAYIILAHQYIAAELNVLSGASIPSAVASAWTAAQALLIAYEGDLDIPKGTADRASAISYAGTLDDYNNGVTGPGHCDDDDDF